MPTFRRRPTEIEAVQFTADAFNRNRAAFPGVDYEVLDHDHGLVRYYVTTIHGQRAYLVDGDWVLPEPDGVHFYPCKPAVFAATYEEVEPARTGAAILRDAEAIVPLLLQLPEASRNAELRNIAACDATLGAYVRDLLFAASDTVGDKA